MSNVPYRTPDEVMAVAFVRQLALYKMNNSFTAEVDDLKYLSRMIRMARGIVDAMAPVT